MISILFTIINGMNGSTVGWISRNIITFDVKSRSTLLLLVTDEYNHVDN